MVKEIFDTLRSRITTLRAANYGFRAKVIISKIQRHPGRTFIPIFAGAVGGAAAIALMEWLSARANFPLMFVPFATSIVLVMGTPEPAPAQPRALFGGHLLATLVGLIIMNLAGPGSAVDFGSIDQLWTDRTFDWI